MARKKEDLSRIHGWEKRPKSILRLDEKQYTVIVERATGRFVGFFVKKDGEIYQTWAEKMAPAEEQLNAAGYVKVAPNACGLLQRQVGLWSDRMFYDQTFLISNKNP